MRIYQLPNSNCLAVRNIKLEVNEPGLLPTIKYNGLLEMRFGLGEHREKCTNADENGCGGVGSWYVNSFPCIDGFVNRLAIDRR